jgi:hypothetical protein
MRWIELLGEAKWHKEQRSSVCSDTQREGEASPRISAQQEGEQYFRYWGLTALVLAPWASDSHCNEDSTPRVATNSIQVVSYVIS